jgi:hypothetical protein
MTTTNVTQNIMSTNMITIMITTLILAHPQDGRSHYNALRLQLLTAPVITRPAHIPTSIRLMVFDSTGPGPASTLDKSRGPRLHTPATASSQTIATTDLDHGLCRLLYFCEVCAGTRCFCPACYSNNTHHHSGYKAPTSTSTIESQDTRRIWSFKL